VITGGAQGIGKGVALQFALSHQAKVCILDINEVQKDSNRYPRKNIFKHEGATTRAAISKSGGICHYFKCDVTSPESVRNCARQIHAHPELGKFCYYLQTYIETH
jgi:NAD(P)-dependent dehydrogenase (short-subunit alcohol dehydrogenase family)